MSVEVLFFASLRDVVDTDRMQLELDEHASMASLAAALKQTLTEEQYARVTAEDVRVAVNQDLLGVDTRIADVELRDGDEIAFMPPITGG